MGQAMRSFRAPGVRMRGFFSIFGNWKSFVEYSPPRVHEAPGNGAEEEKEANQIQRRIPIVELFGQEGHQDRAEQTADLTGGVHGGADHARVVAADVQAGSP